MIQVYRKNDIEINATVYDDENSALDLTGAYVQFVVETPTGVRVIEKTSDDGISIVEPLEGKIVINLDSSDTDIDSGIYRAEILIIDVVGNRYVARVADFNVLTSMTAKE